MTKLLLMTVITTDSWMTSDKSIKVAQMVAGPAEHSWSGVQRAEALWSPSAEGEILCLGSAPQGVNFKTVQWTVLKEGTPCKRGRPLKFLQIHGLINLIRQAELLCFLHSSFCFTLLQNRLQDLHKYISAEKGKLSE